jgi:hypothetical protein
VPVDAVAARTGRTVLMRQREGESSAVDVEVLSSSGATAWVRGLSPEGLREGDRIAADLHRRRDALVDPPARGSDEP